MEEIPYDKLPLGFRFRPTDEQLINHYLKRKINGTIQPLESWVIPEIDMCKTEPWDLPSEWRVKSSDLEWFFFAAVDRKYPSGNRSNRATEKGYWKATGKDRLIKSKKFLVGMKKTLVFHIGRAPRGIGSCWIMHEYRVVNPDGTDVLGDQGAFVLCRLFKKEKETSTERKKEADITKEEFTTPMSQASSNVDLLDEPKSINPEITHGQVTANNMATVPYLVPSTTKLEQSHSNSDITTDVGNHHELRINQELQEESLFDGLKDFLGSDYDLILCAEDPQDYTADEKLFEQQLFTNDLNLMHRSTSNDYCAIDEPSTSEMVGKSSWDSDNLLPICDFYNKGARGHRLPSEMHEPIERGVYFQSNDENLKASSSDDTEINIRHRKPESSDNSINYSDQQGTAERRIKLGSPRQRKVKKQVEIEPPVDTSTVSHQSSSSSSDNDGLTASAISPHLVKPLLQKAGRGFWVPMNKIGVAVLVIVMILCVGIWLLTTYVD